MLKELKEISFLLGDLNAIRNGEFDPPRGSGSTGREIGSQPTIKDVLSRLDDIAGLLEYQNGLLGDLLDRAT
ncbi:hypothetical protein [Pseudolysinimonas kribbensis]|nr:hypothetical protein [Pseudolysinimonas kribbensis]